MPKSLATPLGRSKKTDMEDSSRRMIGRPPKGAYKRSHKVTVAFNDYEFEMMLTLAERAGLRPADWCRKTALKTRLREALSDSERTMLKDNYKIGANLNQLLRLMRARSDWRYEREIKQMLEEQQKINNYFREVLRYGR